MLIRCKLSERFALLEDLEVGAISEGAFVVDGVEDGDALVRAEFLLEGHLGDRGFVGVVDVMAAGDWGGSHGAASATPFQLFEGLATCWLRQDSTREVDVFGDLETVAILLLTSGIRWLSYRGSFDLMGCLQRLLIVCP